MSAKRISPPESRIVLNAPMSAPNPLLLILLSLPRSKTIFVIPSTRRLVTFCSRATVSPVSSKSPCSVTTTTSPSICSCMCIKTPLKKQRHERLGLLTASPLCTGEDVRCFRGNLFKQKISQRGGDAAETQKTDDALPSSGSLRATTFEQELPVRDLILAVADVGRRPVDILVDGESGDDHREGDAARDKD